jgi:predicted transcriptional regulator
MWKPGSVDTVQLAAAVVSAYISNNSLPQSELANLISAVHGALIGLNGQAAAPDDPPALRPAVPIKKSYSDDYIICLEDGRKFKSLKRHLRTKYGMTPEQYRAKWKLPTDYPMVAPGYAEKRSRMAKDMGLGQNNTSKSRKKRP